MAMFDILEEEKRNDILYRLSDILSDVINTELVDVYNVNINTIVIGPDDIFIDIYFDNNVNICYENRTKIDKKTKQYYIYCDGFDVVINVLYEYCRDSYSCNCEKKVEKIVERIKNYCQGGV